MRDTFSSKLVELTQSNPQVLLLTGDHGYGLFNGLREAQPKQFINMGIAEQIWLVWLLDFPELALSQLFMV